MCGGTRKESGMGHRMNRNGRGRVGSKKGPIRQAGGALPLSGQANAVVRQGKKTLKSGEEKQGPR